MFRQEKGGTGFIILVDWLNIDPEQSRGRREAPPVFSKNETQPVNPMIFDKKVYLISCDTCHKLLSQGDSPMQFDLNVTAIETARKLGWAVADQIVCPDCLKKNKR